MPVRILVVDDSVPFLATLQYFLAGEPGLHLVAASHSGEETFRLVAALRPDLVLMDLALPGLGGLEIVRRLKSAPDPPRVVVLTLNDWSEYRRAAAAAGADAFVAKSALRETLVSTIHALVPLHAEER